MTQPLKYVYYSSRNGFGECGSETACERREKIEKSERDNVNSWNIALTKFALGQNHSCKTT